MTGSHLFRIVRLALSLIILSYWDFLTAVNGFFYSFDFFLCLLFYFIAVKLEIALRLVYIPTQIVYTPLVVKL